MHNFIFFAVLVFINYAYCEPPYTPDWASLDKRPIPLWFDDAKFGIFIHWGVFSVPSFGSEWFWYSWKGSKSQGTVDFMNKNFKPNFSYADFGSSFTAELFKPDQWADIFARSGARYVVLTSKHHEGYTLWPSKYSWNWNSVDLGPHRDLVNELAIAVRNKKLTFGLYFSQFEWFNPNFQRDAENNYSTSVYPTTVSLPQMNEIITKYKPEVLWSDGDWEAPDVYWQSQKFLAWLYNDSPVKETIVTNDRWGRDIICKHGDFYTCADNFNPGTLQSHKWENCMTVQKGSWGYDRTENLDGYRTTKEIINSLVDTVSCGGNLLLNIGPTSDGRIMPIFEERLLKVGEWLKINGEAIYGSKPWIHQNDTVTPNVWYTSKLRQDDGEDPRRLQNPQDKSNTIVYASFFEWPIAGLLKLGAPTPSTDTKIILVGTNIKLPWKRGSTGTGVVVDLNDITFLQIPSYEAWTLKIEYLQSDEN